MKETITCSTQTVAFLRQAVDVADNIGLSGVLFRPNLVSGIGGKSGMTIIMCHPHTEELDFDCLALMSPKEVKSRLNLVSGTGTIKIETIQGKIDDDQTQRSIVSKLNMQDGRMKMQYSAAAPKAVKAPRRIEFNSNVEIKVDAAKVIQSLNNAASALTCDATTLIAISCIKDEVIATVTDFNNDNYEDLISTVESDTKSFTHRYYFNYFLSMLKLHDPKEPIVVSDRGVLRFSINKFTIYQLPKV